MPTHEQYIEAARRKLDPCFMWSLDSTNDRTIKFNHNEVYITEAEAESVALEPKQEDVGHCDYPCDADKGYKLICNACTKCASFLVKKPKQEHDHDENCGTKHDHDRGSCKECDSVFEAGWNRCREHLAKNDNNIATYLAGKASHDHNTCEPCLSSRKGAGDAGHDLGYNKGFEAGKALRKPFDVDALAKFIANMSDGSSRIMAQDIADNFAAPERKPISQAEIELVTERVIALHHEDKCMTYESRLRQVLNEVLDLQPAPVEAEAEKCVACGSLSKAVPSFIPVYVAGKKVAALCAHEFHRERGTE